MIIILSGYSCFEEFVWQIWCIFSWDLFDFSFVLQVISLLPSTGRGDWVFLWEVQWKVCCCHTQVQQASQVKTWHLFLSFLEAFVTIVQAKITWRVKLRKWAGWCLQWSVCERGAPVVSLPAVLQFHSKEAFGNPQQCLFLPPYHYTRRTEFSLSHFLGVSGMWMKQIQ